MMKDLTNKKLAGLLIILTVFYVGLELWGINSGRSSSLEYNIVTIDTAAITKVRISQGADNLELNRINGKNWDISLESSKHVPAIHSKVENMISSLQVIRPSSIATGDPGKWRDYQVDSTGKRIEIYEGDQKTLDLVIGRSGMKGQRNLIGYVRRYSDDNVYSVDHFTGSSVSPTAAYYRDQNVLKIDHRDSLVQIKFNYPEEKAFTLINRDSLWYVDETPADSTGVASYLNDLRRITSREFFDSAPEVPGDPEASVVVRSINGQDLILEKFDEIHSIPILRSSANPGNYFADTAALNKIFVKKDIFIKR